MVKPGKFPSGRTEIPFEFPLHVKGNRVLYETYHGVFVNIQVSVSLSRKADFTTFLLQNSLVFLSLKVHRWTQEFNTLFIAEPSHVYSVLISHFALQNIFHV